MFIIQRCRKPVKFTAAKFCDMNMEKFGNVMIKINHNLKSQCFFSIILCMDAKY